MYPDWGALPMGLMRTCSPVVSSLYSYKHLLRPFPPSADLRDDVLFLYSISIMGWSLWLVFTLCTSRFLLSKMLEMQCISSPPKKCWKCKNKYQRSHWSIGWWLLLFVAALYTLHFQLYLKKWPNGKVGWGRQAAAQHVSEEEVGSSNTHHHHDRT